MLRFQSCSEAFLRRLRASSSFDNPYGVEHMLKQFDIVDSASMLPPVTNIPSSLLHLLEGGKERIIPSIFSVLSMRSPLEIGHLFPHASRDLYCCLTPFWKSILQSQHCRREKGGGGFPISSSPFCLFLFKNEILAPSL